MTPLRSHLEVIKYDRGAQHFDPSASNPWRNISTAVDIDNHNSDTENLHRKLLQPEISPIMSLKMLAYWRTAGSKIIRTRKVCAESATCNIQWKTICCWEHCSSTEQSVRGMLSPEESDSGWLATRWYRCHFQHMLAWTVSFCFRLYVLQKPLRKSRVHSYPECCTLFF